MKKISKIIIKGVPVLRIGAPDKDNEVFKNIKDLPKKVPVKIDFMDELKYYAGEALNFRIGGKTVYCDLNISTKFIEKYSSRTCIAVGGKTDNITERKDGVKVVHDFEIMWLGITEFQCDTVLQDNLKSKIDEVIIFEEKKDNKKSGR